LSSIADPVHGGATAPLPKVDSALALGCFAAAVTAGLVGAFVGLDAFGFWFDELFTRRVVDPAAGLEGLFARIASDVHPPVYPMLLFFYAKVTGESDQALRAFSAVSACAAVLTFVAATTGAFSLRGRLFGAAVATSSLFWFFQSQNARSYALCLLIGAGIAALSLRLIQARQDRAGGRVLALLLALMLVGSFTHFYVLYESLAVLMVLALLRTRDRVVTIGAAGLLVVAVSLYVKLVMAPHSQASLDNNWYPNNPGWYLQVLASSWQYTFGLAGGVALAVCAGAAVVARLPGHSGLRWRPSPAFVLLAGVPAIVLLGAIVSSTLLSPNFFDRNYLVISPFFWAIAAALYDAATVGTPARMRRVVNVSTSLLIVSMAAIVLQRPQSERPRVLYEPFRESAEWVSAQQQCRDAVVPVITTDRRAWYKPGFADALYGSVYGYYLAGFAKPQLIFLEDLRSGDVDPDLIGELSARAAGHGCPILAWSAHNVGPRTFDEASRALLRAIGGPAATSSPKLKRFEEGQTGFALYVDR
jgi:uncharacterized membrane protein